MNVAKILKKENLYIRILIGFLIGILLGVFLPKFSISIKALGDIYLNLIKMLITPIVFCSVYCSILSLNDIKKLKKVGLSALFLFVALFLACCIISLLVVMFINPGRGISLASEWQGTLADTSISSFFKKIITPNILQSFVSGDTLQVILFTVVFGLATLTFLRGVKKERYILPEVILNLRDFLYKTFGYFMEWSPIGVMSLIAYSVASYGASIFGDLAKYIATCWICCIICLFLVLMFPVVLYAKIPFKKLISTYSKVALVSMSTASSAATLPTTMKACVEDLNCQEDLVNFIAPLGCTIHMCGGACSFMCLMLFVAQMNNITLPIGTIFLAVVIATLINMAAPGIPGGGIVLGATFLSIIGLPLEFIGIYAGIYRVLDIIYTTVNVLGDISVNIILNKKFALKK